MAVLDLGPGVRTVALESDDRTLYSETHGGQVRVRKTKGQRWRLTLAWPRMRYDQARPIFAQLAGLRGRYGTIDIIPPGYQPLGSATGSPVVSGASQVGGTLNTTGWSPNITGIMRAGDILRMAHGKVYMVIADATSDSAGNATLQITPDLVSSPADQEAITVTDVAITCRQDADQVQVSQDGNIVTLRASFVEDVL